MPIAKNGAVDVFYEITGNGKPLVLIMGLGADHTVWEKHLAAYEKQLSLPCNRQPRRRSIRTENPMTPTALPRWLTTSRQRWSMQGFREEETSDVASDLHGRERLRRNWR